MHLNNTPKLCECGCGQPVPIATRSRARDGAIKGQPRKFVYGHAQKAPPSIAQAFWKRCQKGLPDACWEWQGSRDDCGYGRFGYQRKKYSAHRVSYAIHHGAIPDNEEVLHSCDNPPCCNPSHLSRGPHAANAADMVDKDRQAKGEQIGRSKLTESSVREIRRLHSQGVSRKELRNRFGVGKECIRSVVSGETWRHVI